MSIYRSMTDKELYKVAIGFNIEVTEEMLDQLAEYMDFHIEARYPGEKKAFYDKCTEEFARNKIAEMEKVYKWLTQKLDK